MTTYDEDLAENGWYLALSRKHEDLFIRATNERWMICVPRMGSWKSGIEDGDLFSQKSFESHILKPLVMYGGTQDGASQDGGVHDVVAQDTGAEKYIAYNGKEVHITGSTVTCGEGFTNNFNVPSYDKHNEHLNLHMETSHTSQILFEETFFNQHDESYIVLCLSHPLEQHLVSGADKDSSQSEEEKSSGPRWELYGSFIWMRAHQGMKLRNFIDEKIAQYIAERKYPYNFEERSGKSDDQLVLEVKAIAEGVNGFVSMLFQNAIRNSKLRKFIEVPAQKVAVHSSLESYALHGIYTVNMRELNDIMSRQDQYLNKITRNLASIKFSDLEINEEFCSTIPRARRELSLLNRYRTPGEKLTCVENSIRFLSARKNRHQSSSQTQFSTDSCKVDSTKNEPTVMSSDDLLPILIYLVIKCEVANWFANLAYMKHFHFTKTTQDQSGFYLATLEAAVEHVRHRNVKIDKIKVLSSHGSVQELQHFFETISNGDVASVDRMLRQAEDFRNLHDHDKCHPLCECTNCNKLSNRRASRGKDISVTTRDDKGRTALHIAALTGRHEVVETLLSHGSDINASDYHGSTPLHLAAQEGSQSVIFLLLHYGAAANQKENNNNTALHLACYGGHDGSVKAMLYYDPVRAVVKLDATNDNGDTPLHMAAKWGYAAIAQALVECGANITRQNRKKETPLDLAHNSQIKYILLNTDLTVAYVGGSVENQAATNPRFVKVKPLPQNRSQSTASKQKAYKPIGQFQPPKPNLHKQISNLHRAVADNDVNMVSYMCGWGAPVTSNQSCDPLCQCIKCQPTQEVLVHANSTSPDGTTPLLISSKRGFIELTRMLLDHGANVGCRSKDHRLSPLHLSCQYGHEKIVRMLLDHGANCDIRNTEGNTPIYMCAANGHTACAKTLLEFGASVNIRNQKADSPLHQAVKWRNIDVVHLLMQSGAMTYYKNKHGVTPVQMAKDDRDIYDVLMSQSRDEEFGDVTAITEAEPPIEPIKNHRSKSISRSEADELLADGLFDRFTPGPTTPPIISRPFTYDSDSVNSSVIHDDHMNEALCDSDHLTGTGFYKTDHKSRQVGASSDDVMNSDVTNDVILGAEISEHSAIKDDNDITSAIVTTENDVVSVSQASKGDELNNTRDNLVANNATTPPNTSPSSLYFEIETKAKMSENPSLNTACDVTSTSATPCGEPPEHETDALYLSLNERNC